MRFTIALCLALAVPAFASPPTEPPDTGPHIVAGVDVVQPELALVAVDQVAADGFTVPAGMELAATTQHNEGSTAMQTPTIGRIVHYRLTQADADNINEREARPGERRDGNSVKVGEVVPLIVTKVWPEEYAENFSADRASSTQAKLPHHPSGVKYESSVGINGQALLDGSDSLWVTSAPQGDLDGCWNWPPREPVAGINKPQSAEARSETSTS